MESASSLLVVKPKNIFPDKQSLGEILDGFIKAAQRERIIAQIVIKRSSEWMIIQLVDIGTEGAFSEVQGFHVVVQGALNN